MVGTENIVINICLFDPAFFNDILRHEKVIDAPSDIAIPGFKAVGPPRVFYGIREKMPEGVHIAVMDDPVPAVPFDSSETGFFFIGFRVFQIDIVVSRIIVAGNDEVATLFSIRIGVFKESFVKIKLILKPFIAHLTIGKVDVKEDKIIKIQFNNAPFLIKSGNIKRGVNACGFDARISADATLTFFYCGVRPKGHITSDIFHFVGQLIFLNLGLLNGKNIRIQLMEGCKKIFFDHGS